MNRYQKYPVITSKNYSVYNIISITVSCNTGLNFFILSLLRDGCKRFVKSIIIIDRLRSIQNDVPVKPRCPILLLEKKLQQLESSEDGVSNPSALSESF